MIIGIGVDLVEIKRVEKNLSQFGDRFLKRMFSPTEIRKAYKGKTPAKTLASRFAAKEAAAKALGMGVSKGIRFSDFQVENDKAGKPLLKIKGKAAIFLKKRLPKGGKAQIDLSLSEEKTMAMAFVIISVRF